MATSPVGGQVVRGGFIHTWSWSWFSPLLLKLMLALGASNLSRTPSSNLCLSCGVAVNQDRLVIVRRVWCACADYGGATVFSPSNLDLQPISVHLSGRGALQDRLLAPSEMRPRARRAPESSPAPIQVWRHNNERGLPLWFLIVQGAAQACADCAHQRLIQYRWWQPACGDRGPASLWIHLVCRLWCTPFEHLRAPPTPLHLCV
jgi:hypothetical protein